MRKAKPKKGKTQRPGAAARAIATGRVTRSNEIRVASRLAEKRATMNPSKGRAVVEERLTDMLHDPLEIAEIGARKPGRRTTPTRQGKVRTAQGLGMMKTERRPGRGKLSAKTKKTDSDVVAYVDQLDERTREIFERLQIVVAEAAPRAELHIKWGRPVWELNGPLFYFAAAKKHADFGFYRGASLKDIDHLLNNSGPRNARYMRITDPDGIPPRALSRLVQQAARSASHSGI